MKTQDNLENKTLEFLFQETAIHFLVHPNDDNVMVNATEMAKLFNKRTDNYLQTAKAIEFINELKVPDMSGTLESKSQLIRGEIIDNRGRNGIWFCQDLAIDFAMWLDVKFRVWVSRKIKQSLTEKTKNVKSAISLKEQKKKERKELIKKAVKENNTDLLDLLKVDRAIAKADYQEQKAIKELKSQYKMDL